MRTLLPLILLTALAAPAAGQDIPTNIPDLPGESPADRAQEQLIEAHYGFLSRIFSVSSFDAAPLPPDGFGYQTNVGFGLDLPTGDAVFVAISGRLLPLDRERPEPGGDAWLWYAGAGYTLSGARFLGETETGYRTALTAEVGVWSGQTSLVALDVSPTYEVFRGRNWSMPAGLRFSLARVQGPDGAVLHPFAGITVGAKIHLFARDRLELK